MNSDELKKIILNLKRQPNQKVIKPAPVIHEGFPSCFNLSFAEYEMYHSFGGQYLDYDRGLLFSKTQPCIRHQDWKSILNQDKDSYRYLSVFDMVDVGGMLIFIDSSKQNEINKIVINSFLDFIDIVGLDKSKLVISYFESCSINEATAEKYKIDKIIPTDPMLNYWIEKGLNKKQLIPDKTRDTFLSLNIFGKPTPWGYRNEIHYKYNGELLDIGTVEFLPFSPVFKNGEIFNVTKNKHAVAVSAIGFERVLMVLNDLDFIWEIDTILPLVEALKEKSFLQNDSVVFVQALRAIHQIVSDGGLYKSLNKRRKEYARKLFYSSVYKLSNDYNIDIDFIERLLEMNAGLQKSMVLEKGIKNTISEIIDRNNSFRNDKSLKNKNA